MKGYKVFNPDWTCRNKQYSCPGIFEQTGELKLCENGIHFCKKLIDCFNYYEFNPKNKVAEIKTIGKVIGNESEGKYCTSKIRIIKELSWYKVLNLVNTGKNNTGFKNTGNYNTGYKNSGDYNTGDYNTGDDNSGEYNSGDCNSGDCNTGDYNTGNFNTGNFNTGSCNTGSRNIGNYNSGRDNAGNFNSGGFNFGNYNTGNYNTSDYNSGDYNSGVCNTGFYNIGNYNTGYYNSGSYNTGHFNSGERNSGNHNFGKYNTGDYNFGSYNTGCFNLKENKLYFFDEPSNWTYEDWEKSLAFQVISKMPPENIFISSADMTEEEKSKNPEYRKMNGCLKYGEKKELNLLRQKWWESLSEEDKKSVLSLPNFDVNIFKEITGIDATVEK